MTRLIHHWGELQAAEIDEGRRVRAIIDEIARANGRGVLVISRRAKRFRDECSSLEAQDLIDGAVRKAGLSLTATEFSQLIALACQRDKTACRDLAGMAKQLAPHLPEKRGRPISAETCAHIFLLRHLESWGIDRAYTYSEEDGYDDFVDPVTQATRIAANNPRFSPLHANRLRKSNLFPPPMLIRAPGATGLPGSAARPNRCKRGPQGSEPHRL